MLRRYPNLVLPFVDEITRLPAITDVIAEILGPDLSLDAPFFIKDAQSKVCILASRPATGVWNRGEVMLGSP